MHRRRHTHAHIQRANCFLTSSSDKCVLHVERSLCATLQPAIVPQFQLQIERTRRSSVFPFRIRQYLFSFQYRIFLRCFSLSALNFRFPTSAATADLFYLSKQIYSTPVRSLCTSPWKKKQKAISVRISAQKRGTRAFWSVLFGSCFSILGPLQGIKNDHCIPSQWA